MADDERKTSKRSRFDQTEPEVKRSRFDRRSRSPSARKPELRRSRSPKAEPRSPASTEKKTIQLDPAAAAGMLQ